jgi:hypothetical protein
LGKKSHSDIFIIDPVYNTVLFVGGVKECCKRTSFHNLTLNLPNIKQKFNSSTLLCIIASNICGLLLPAKG